MRRYAFFYFAMLIIGIQYGCKCENPSLEGAVYNPPGGWEILIPPSTPSECTGPRPDPDGCKQPCKPCYIYVCQNGEWVRVKLENPPGMCEGGKAIPGDKVTYCPRTPEGYCPPECSYCF